MEMKKRDKKESVIVVLDGQKTYKEEKGVVPLSWALGNVLLCTNDEVLVLNILNFAVGFCCLKDHASSTCQGKERLRSLRQQITQRRETYHNIFRPFYNHCKNIEVKFEVKVSAGFQPKALVISEANNVKATWIVLGRSSVDVECLQVGHGNCKVALVNDNEEAEIHGPFPYCRPDNPEVIEEEGLSYSYLTKQRLLDEEPHIRDALRVSKPSFLPTTYEERRTKVEIASEQDSIICKESDQETMPSLNSETMEGKNQTDIKIGIRETMVSKGNDIEPSPLPNSPANHIEIPSEPKTATESLTKQENSVKGSALECIPSLNYQTMHKEDPSKAKPGIEEAVLSKGSDQESKALLELQMTQDRKLGTFERGEITKHDCLAKGADLAKPGIEETTLSKGSDLDSKALLSSPMPQDRNLIMIETEEITKHDSLANGTNLDPMPSSQPQISCDENEAKTETTVKETSRQDFFSKLRDLKPMLQLKLPIEIDLEDIEEIADQSQAGRIIQEDENSKMFIGILHAQMLPILVKRLSGDLNHIIEAEKRASQFMSHRNILPLIGYHKSSKASTLVYHYAGEGSLDQYLSRTIGRPSGLTCRQRMKIAIEVGQGIRYFQEECPGGPVYHGDLRPCKVFLGPGFQPQITGFGQARWLQMEKMVRQGCYNRCQPEELSEQDTKNLRKSDILSFGLLLLRLFCRRPLPEDDVQLVDWARPLLLQGAFHELLDHDMDDLDMYEIYRVMAAATHCTKAKPRSCLSMTQVVSILRGENSCVLLQSSPSSECTMGRETNIFL